MYLPNGTTLKGTYRIVRFIASGGFGCTYEAQHVMLGKRVAIKEFFIENFHNRDAQTSRVCIGIESKKALVEKLKNKFIDEARSIAQMSHPNIVTVSDVFEDKGTAYYVMDYIDGDSLSQIVRRRGCLPEKEALRYIKDVASALKYVHSLNRLHLDIKPANIMVGRDGHVMLIDFGVSKQYDEINGENTSTLMGYSAGYAPVEQMGNRVKTFTPATDIYALGATFYSLLSGIMPPLDATDRADEDTLEPLPSVISTPVRNAIKKAMNVSRNGRVQSIEEFLKNLSTSDASLISAPASPETANERTLISDNTKSSQKVTAPINMQVEVHAEAETDPDAICLKALELHDKKKYKEAFSLFMQSANLGCNEALYQVGEYYFLGFYYSKDQNKAFIWFKKAAELGDGHREAQYKLGNCYEHGAGTDKSWIEAFKWYKKAAEKGHKEAQQKLGDYKFQFLLAKSYYYVQSYQEAVYWYKKSAEQGNCFAQYSLALCYDCGKGVSIDKSQARYWLEKSAKYFGSGAYKLGIYYKSGDGVDVDERKAVEWFTMAAEQGNVEAQYELGLCYKFGKGVDLNEDKAIEWFAKAAEHEHKNGQYELARCYEKGMHGFTRDPNKALSLYTKAAKQGNEDAIKWLNLYNKRQNEKAYAKALSLYKKKRYDKVVKVLENLATQGVPEAQHLLGECYFFGQGVLKDESKATELYTKAAKQGNKDANDMLAIINGNLSLESAPPTSNSSNKNELRNEADKQKEKIETEVHEVESQQQRKEHPTSSIKENKNPNHIVRFVKKIFS